MLNLRNPHELSGPLLNSRQVLQAEGSSAEPRILDLVPPFLCRNRCYVGKKRRV